MAEWYESFPEAPAPPRRPAEFSQKNWYEAYSEAPAPPQRPAEFSQKNWYEAYPEAPRQPPNQGGYVAEGLGALKTGAREAWEGAKETAQGMGRDYASAAGQHSGMAGPIYGVGNALRGLVESPAADLAASTAMGLGGVEFGPSQNMRLAHEPDELRPPASRNLRPDEGVFPMAVGGLREPPPMARGGAQEGRQVPGQADQEPIPEVNAQAIATGKPAEGGVAGGAVPTYPPQSSQGGGPHAQEPMVAPGPAIPTGPGTGWWKPKDSALVSEPSVAPQSSSKGSVSGGLDRPHAIPERAALDWHHEPHEITQEPPGEPQIIRKGGPTGKPPILGKPKIAKPKGVNEFSKAFKETMKKAKALGYDIKKTYYHGTGKDFEEFTQPYGNEKAVFLTEDPNIANTYAQNKSKPNIIPLLLNKGKTKNINWKAATGSSGYSGTSMKYILDKAKGEGYDTVVIKNIHDIGSNGAVQTQIAVLNPVGRLRAKFGAKFEPEMAASGNMLSAAPGPPGAAPGAKATHANVIEQELEHYKLANREQLRRTEVRKALEAKPPELTPEVEQKLYAHAENDFSAGRLTPEEDALYETHIEPWLDRNKEIFKEIRTQGRKLGIADAEIEEVHPGYMHRMVQGKTRDLDRAAGFEAHDPGTGASKGFGGTYQAPATKSRTYYAIVSNGGERRVVHVENGHVYDASTGKLIKSRQALGEGFSPQVGVRFGDGGKTWTFAHAKTSEIEGVTDTRYIKSASASVLNNYLELERMRDRLALVQRTQERFIHEGMATRNVKEAQRQKWTASKFPGMEGVYMDKRLASAMDKFSPKVAEENLADYLVRAENFLNSTLFWNPLPHARNVFMHAMIERGWSNFAPWTYPGAAMDAKRAFTDVSTNSELYQEVQKVGAATMFPRVANRGLFEKMVEGFEAPENKSALESLASKLAMPIAALHNLVYVKFAQQGLWFSNDMAIMQRVREKVRRVPGMTVPRAVEELHKDVPDYRIPSEVLFPGKPGRLISQTIAGRYTNLFLRFTRFHYSVAKTYIYPAADIVKGVAKITDPAARREAINAVGKLVALATSYELMNIVGNKAVERLTGDEKARIAMWGPLAYVRLIDDLVSGRVNDEASFIKAATAGLFSMSPLIEVGLQALGINYRLQPDYAYQKAGPGEKAISIAGQGVAPISQAKKYYERGPGYLAADVTVGAGRTPMTNEEYKALKKTPEYKFKHPRKPTHRNEDARAVSNY